MLNEKETFPSNPLCGQRGEVVGNATGYEYLYNVVDIQNVVVYARARGIRYDCLSDDDE